MSDPITLTSPRIAALKQALEAGDHGAVDAFWAELAQSGTPLIEDIPGDRRNSLVTFVWRGDSDTRGVVVAGGLNHLDPSEGCMSRLLDTDVWFHSSVARNDLRTTYLFGPNDPGTPLSAAKSVAEMMVRLMALRSDPLNPKSITQGTDWGKITFSIVELSQALPQPWVEKRPGVPAGMVDVHSMHSEILGNERKVWVYTPPEYSAAGGPYGLLLVFDGEAYSSFVPTPTILDNLLAENRIPPMIAVMVGSLDQATRKKELSCYAPHADFLVKELMPFLRERYRVTSDPSRTFIGGCSLGGLSATFMAWRHPEVFGNVLSQSGSYGWSPAGASEPEWTAKQFVDRDRLPLRFYMDIGLLENRMNPKSTLGVSHLGSNRHLRDVLRAKGYPVHYTEYMGAHDHAVWRGTLADGLLALLGMANG